MSKHATEAMLDNIQQKLIENMADFLDDESTKLDEAIALIKDTVPAEESELHIRMANAAFNEYKNTMLASQLHPVSKSEGVAEELFKAQQKLAKCTGTILGLRKVMTDYDGTEKGRAVGEDLSKVADEITEALNILRASPTPDVTEAVELNKSPIKIKYMNFGQAIEALKEGKSVSRNGWNGKGMFIYLNKGSHDFSSKDGKTVEIVSHIDGVSAILFEGGDTGTITRLPNLNMKSASGSTVTGWLASQTDLLAEDWGIVD